MKLNIGITFSGVLHNNQDRVFDYEIDPSLVPMGKKILPTHYYTCNNASQIVVSKGELKGYLTVELDSVLFLNDPRSLTGEYVIPIRLLLLIVRILYHQVRIIYVYLLVTMPNNMAIIHIQEKRLRKMMVII